MYRNRFVTHVYMGTEPSRQLLCLTNVFSSIFKFTHANDTFTKTPQHRFKPHTRLKMVVCKTVIKPLSEKSDFKARCNSQSRPRSLLPQR